MLTLMLQVLMLGLRLRLVLVLLMLGRMLLVLLALLMENRMVPGDTQWWLVVRAWRVQWIDAVPILRAQGRGYRGMMHILSIVTLRRGLLHAGVAFETQYY
jgi:hypothetical protein